MAVSTSAPEPARDSARPEVDLARGQFGRRTLQGAVRRHALLEGDLDQGDLVVTELEVAGAPSVVGGARRPVLDLRGDPVGDDRGLPFGKDTGLRGADTGHVADRIHTG